MKYRRLRVQDFLREEISFIIQRDIKDPGIGLATILEVKVTEDLKIAKVYCSVYGNEEEKKNTMDGLKRSRGYIKYLLGKRTELRYIPDIIFLYDDRFDKMARIEEILKKEAHAGED
jgi:ribosome-binding factor A